MKKKLTLMAVAVVFIIVFSVVAFNYLLVIKPPSPNAVRIACVGDSLTSMSRYPYDLWVKLGRDNYNVGNFGKGATMVGSVSETPYVNTTQYIEALQFNASVVIVMLGTNDAQPSMHPYNASFIPDYVKLLNSFKALPNQPKIWVVLPPPIFDSQNNKIDPQYFKDVVIPNIRQVANQTGLPIIDVYSAAQNYPEFFPDGIHPNDDGAQMIANTVFKAITESQPPLCAYA
jgi:lysophospholipase L1-like esterase